MAKDLIPVPYSKGDECLLAKVNALRELQSAGGKELLLLCRPSQGSTSRERNPG